MTTFALTLPGDRVSPVRVPRRDLVLASADSIYLRVTIVGSDDPSAPAIPLTGDVFSDPVCSLVIWRDGWENRSWDYGWPCHHGTPDVLWSGQGVVPATLDSFDFFIPSGTMMQWPLRCGWSVQLDFAGPNSETLAGGVLHLRRSALGPVASPVPIPPPINPPGPIVRVEFTLDRDQLSMGAMLAAGTDGYGGQPGSVGVGVFMLDVSRMDMGVKI